MMLAVLNQPHLSVAFSEQPSGDKFSNQAYHSGALTLANMEAWAVGTSAQQFNERAPDVLQERAEHELAEYLQLGPKALEVLPLENVPWLRLASNIWGDVLDHVEDPSYFAANDVRSKLPDVAIPIYHVGGWFDPFLRNTVDHYKGAAAATANQRLLVGPWTHGGTTRSSAGDSMFPDSAFDDFGYTLAWHDRWLRGTPALPAQEHSVIVYVMGANR
jgi:putative CocE/NonD family hydrolase